MLDSNSTLVMLSLGTGIFGSDYASAIARGLSTNTSLQTLKMCATLQPGALHGPTWSEALEKNNALHELILEQCRIGPACTDFEAFARGLSSSKSLKILNLSSNDIDNAQATMLVESLRGNEILESLNLAGNAIEGSGGADVVRGLWFMKNLKCLNVCANQFGGGCNDGTDETLSTTVFSEGLPTNDTLKKVNFAGCAISSSDLCSIASSLHGSRALESLMLDENLLRVDGAAATALKDLLLSSSLNSLSMYQDVQGEVTLAGMTEVAAGLRGNTHLRYLMLGGHEMDNETLVTLGEALQVNSKLESLDIDCYCNSYDGEGQRRFFGLLPLMNGLKSLGIDSFDQDESGFEEIIDGVRRNTSLESIPGLSDSALVPPDVLESIEFYLKMNRNGRKYLQDEGETIHMGTWPHILAKLTFPSERDQLFYFLRHKAASLVRVSVGFFAEDDDNDAAVAPVLPW